MMTHTKPPAAAIANRPPSECSANITQLALTACELAATQLAGLDGELVSKTLLLLLHAMPLLLLTACEQLGVHSCS